VLSPLSVLQRCPCRRSECPEFGFSLFVCARLTSLPFFFCFCFCFPPPPLSPPACPVPAVPSNALSIVPVQSPAPSWPSLPQLGIATFFLPSGSPPSRCFSFSFFFFFFPLPFSSHSPCARCAPQCSPDCPCPVLRSKLASPSPTRNRVSCRPVFPPSRHHVRSPLSCSLPLAHVFSLNSYLHPEFRLPHTGDCGSFISAFG